MNPAILTLATLLLAVACKTPSATPGSTPTPATTQTYEPVDYGESVYEPEPAPTPAPVAPAPAPAVKPLSGMTDEELRALVGGN